MVKKIIPVVLSLFFLIGCGSKAIKPPVLLEDLEPQYPEAAKEEGLQGNVGLYLFVDDDGNVERVTINKSSGHTILDSAAIEYGEDLAFKPAKRGDEPISVWLTWVVNYKSEDVYFLPLEYVERVQKLFRKVDRTSGAERDSAWVQILTEHDEFVEYLADKPNLNYNEYVQKFVKQEVYDQWELMWKEWPMRFVVYHDFVLRYPDSKYTDYASSRMLELIKENIIKLRGAVQYRSELARKENKIFRTIYTFLAEKYPNSLTGDFRDEAKKYIPNLNQIL